MNSMRVSISYPHRAETRLAEIELGKMGILAMTATCPS